MPYWRLFYHFVWGTKNGEPLIPAAWEAQIHEVIAKKATELGAVVHAVGGMPNHVHLVASVPPKVALSDFVGQVKGRSAHFVNHSTDAAGEFAWQAEYGVVSFSGKLLRTVVKYVKNQKQHHALGTYISRLERSGNEVTRGARREPDTPRGTKAPR